MTSANTSEQRNVVTWEQFSEVFHERYVPLAERERLSHEYFGSETHYYVGHRNHQDVY